MSKCASCGYLPCQCAPSTTPTSGCDDPGMVLNGDHFYALDEDFCPVRMEPYKGVDGNGDRLTGDQPVRPAYLIQNEDGKPELRNPPCIPFPDYELTTDGFGYGTNGFDTLVGKSSGCEMDVSGYDSLSGFLFWNHESSRWEQRQGIPEIPACVYLENEVNMMPETQIYTFRLTGNIGGWAVDGVVTVRQYKFKITSIISISDTDARISVELQGDPLDDAVDLVEGECVYWSGFEPPDFCNLDDITEEEGLIVVDSIFGCKDGELMTIPSQDGKILVGRSDGKWELSSGSGRVMVTPDSVVNESGVAPSSGNATAISVSTLTGYDKKYKFIIFCVRVFGTVISEDYTMEVTIGGYRVGYIRVTAAFDSDSTCGEFTIPIPAGDTPSLTPVRTVNVGTPGTASAYNIEVQHIGWER